jgi:serine/alanine adding enzyme
MLRSLVNTVSDLENTDWDEYFNSNQFRSPFQSKDFVNFITRSKDQKAILYLGDNGGKITSSCLVTIQKERGPKGFFSKRAIIYGGPLLKNASKNDLSNLLDYICEDLKQKVIYIESRNLFDYSEFVQVIKSKNWKYVPYYNLQLDIEGKDSSEIMKNMQYNRRREIRLSLEGGAVYSEATSLEEVKTLYSILQNLYKTRVKLPLPDLTYFQNIFTSNIGKVFIVKHNENIIGGSFCFLTPSSAIYTLYYCGNRDYNKKIFPTHLAVLAAIEYGIRVKLKKVDFMGAGQPDQKYGVRKYKEEFGGTLVEHGRFLHVNKPMLYSIGKIGLKVLGKIRK